MGKRGQTGDKIRGPCDNCSTQYSYILGADGPKGSSRFCPTCYEEFEKIKEEAEKVGGTWRVRNDRDREKIINAIEENTEFKVIVKDRLNELQLYRTYDEIGEI